jgi:TonB family protein
MKVLPVRPVDLLERSLPAPSAPAGDGREGVWFDIDPAATALPATARPDPMLAATMFLGELAEPERLDPGRATAEPAAMPLGRPQPRLTLGLAGSLGVHLLPLLLLLHWSGAPPEIAAPIPVQLVFETPPAPPPTPAPAPPAPEKKPPPGRLASEDMGEAVAKPNQPAAAAEEAADRPEETVVAAVQPPSNPTRPPKLVSALPKPTTPAEPAALPPEPKPTPAGVMPRLKHAAVARLAPNPHLPRRARVPGPAATRDEYLAYCLSLIRRHFDLLPPSFLAGRRGATVLRIKVLGDGTIARVAVARRSPYPDIDAKIEEAVAAVRRFPPVPQWFQGPSVSLTLQVGYPEGL